MTSRAQTTASLCCLLLVAITCAPAHAVDEPVDGNVPPATTRPADRQYKLTYRLSKGADQWDPAVRKRITDAMDAAVALYNEVAEFDKAVIANHNPGTPTADANYNGWINFGGQIGRRTALHEIAHTLGVGQHKNWHALIKDGKWTGPHALAQLRAFDGPDAVLRADRQHFWPYGLNFEKESSPENDRRHVLMVAALRKDTGIVNGPSASAGRAPATTQSVPTP